MSKLKYFYFLYVAYLALLPGHTLYGQDVEALLARYKNEQAVTTFFKREMIIKNERGKLTARSNISTEKLLIGDLSPGIYNKEYIFHSYFNRLEEYDALALIPGKKGYVKNEATEVKTSHYEDNDVLYDDNQQTEISFSGLVPRSLLQCNYTLSHTDLHMLPSFYMQENMPVAQSVFTVTVPKYVKMKFVIKGFMADKVKQTVEESKNTITYTFTATDLPAIQHYDYVSSIDWYTLHIIPYVFSYRLPGEDTEQIMGDTDHLYTYLYNFIKDVNVKEDEQISRIAEMVTKGDKTEHEKAAHIYQWVQSNIHYVAFEDSLGGYIPRQAALVCSRKFGDCKDMASILVALCRKAGINAYFAWIGTDAKPYTYEETPLPKVANHMICAIETGGEWIFMDGTHPLIPFGSTPSALQGKEALIGINEREYKIITIPAVAPEINLLTDSTLLEITGKQVNGKTLISFEGFWSWYIQGKMVYRKNEARDKFMRSFLERGSNKYIQKKYEYTPTDTGSKPCRIAADFVLDDYVQKIGKEYYLNMNLKYYFEDNNIDTEKRKVPEYFAYMDLEREVVILTIPAGYHVSYLPPAAAGSVPGVWSFDLRYTNEGNKVILKKEYKITSMVLLPHQFAQHNKMLDELKRQYKETLVITAD